MERRQKASRFKFALTFDALRAARREKRLSTSLVHTCDASANANANAKAWFIRKKQTQMQIRTKMQEKARVT